MPVRPHIRLRAALATIAVAIVSACDRPLPTGTPEERVADRTAPNVARRADRPQLERLARRMARAMADPTFRAAVKAQLDSSPVVEHKLHFQRFLHGGGRRALRRVAQLNRESEDTVAAEAARAVTLEMYFPVPNHRTAWTGGDNILVATAIADKDTPVAYDVRGRRHVLDPNTPPTIPVLAVVPAEIDFDRPELASAASCAELRIAAACIPGTSTPPPTTAATGVYMTKSHFRETFESWLKGAPEIEILVLGQKGTSDSLTRYQCIGQRAMGSYYFDQNSVDWTGNVLLFNQTQLNNYKQQHPGQALRLFFMEDDDTSCELRTSATSIQKLISTVDGITRGLSGGRDTTTATQRVYKYAQAAQKLWAVLASFINTNDDMIGNAVESATIGEYYSGYNWVLKGENGRTNGYINLQMR